MFRARLPCTQASRRRGGWNQRSRGRIPRHHCWRLIAAECV